MQKYDITSKVLFEDYARDFVRLTIKEGDFEIIERIPTEQPTVQMRMTDAPVKVRVGDKEVIVHTEFQTETSKVSMELRLSEYIGRLIRQHGIPVYVTVIYLGESAGKNDQGALQYAYDDIFSYSLKYQVIRLPEIDGEEILGKKELVGLIPFSALMKRPEGVTKEEWLRQCAENVLSVEMDPVQKQDYVGSFLVLSSLNYEADLITSLLKEGIMMINFEEFPLVKMFVEKARAEERAEAEKARAEVQAEAEKARVEAQAEAEKTRVEAQAEAEKTRAEGYARALAKILETEYGKKGLRELGEQIQAIQDEEKLFALIEPALTSPTLDEFKRVLAKM